MRSLIIEVLFMIELRTMTSFIKYCELIALYSKCSGFLSRKIVKIYDFLKLEMVPPSTDKVGFFSFSYPNVN